MDTCVKKFVISCASIWAALLILQLQPSSALAQSSQYKRSKPKETLAPSKSEATTKKKNSEKVDLSDLEKKYWVPKDTEFQVVQNRTYTKANRPALTVHGGLLINDPYSKAFTWGLTGSYFFSERWGIEASYLNFRSEDSTLTQEFRNTYLAVPDHNKLTSYYGAGLTWVPVYAKLSLLEQQIIYFDMSLTTGVGMMTYEQQYFNSANTSKSEPALAIDLAQHYFLSKNFALRVDLKNRLFNEEVRNARLPSEVKRTKLNHTMIFLMGVTVQF